VKGLLQQLKTSCLQYSTGNKRWFHYLRFWKSGGMDNEAEQIARQLEGVVEILKNSDQNIVLNKTMDFPIINTYRLTNFRISTKLGIAMAVVFPVGGIVYLIAVYRRKLLHQDINTTVKVCDEMVTIIDDKNIK
jgi:lipopolysaccharide export system permease protein